MVMAPTLYYYIYLDKTTGGYEIYQSSGQELGCMADDGEYFAAFTRLIDASNYVKALNLGLAVATERKA
jgi:hypothetical protein